MIRLALATARCACARRSGVGRHAAPAEAEGLQRRHRLESITGSSTQVGKHPSVFGFFTRWNGPVEYIYDAVERSRLSADAAHLHAGRLRHAGGRDPRGIAKGAGDRYLVKTTGGSPSTASPPTCASWPR